MSEIECAIEHTKKYIKSCKMLENYRLEHGLPLPETALDIHKTILQALEEKQQREQGCEGCKHDGFNKSGNYLFGEPNPCFGCCRNLIMQNDKYKHKEIEK